MKLLILYEELQSQKPHKLALLCPDVVTPLTFARSRCWS